MVGIRGMRVYWFPRVEIVRQMALRSHVSSHQTRIYISSLDKRAKDGATQLSVKTTGPNAPPTCDDSASDLNGVELDC